MSEDNLAKIQTTLQNSLIKGWEEFITNPLLFENYRRFHEFIHGAGFSESGFRQVIADPAYGGAARIVGRYFPQTARKLGISFDVHFPGNFSESHETEEDGSPVRHFSFLAYDHKISLPLYRVTLSFTHLHREFGFPKPPRVNIQRLEDRVQ